MEAYEVKSALPIPFVLDRAGIQYEVGGDGRCHARCPFHDDSRPSFDVFGPTLARWRCSPCGVGGDVFDLLERLGLAECYSDAVELGEWMVGLLRESEWTGPTSALPRREFDFGAAARVVLRSREDLAGLRKFLDGRPDLLWEVGALHDEWGVGSVGDRVIIPYFDRNGNLMAYKHRTPDTKPLSATGAHFTDLYGAWRDDPARTCPVLLVEGESDAWSADFWVGDKWSVLGVPSGAGSPPEPLLERLEGRLVRIAFDGDKAGREGAERWAKACGGLIVPIPDDMDVAAVGSGIGGLIAQSAVSWPRVGMRPTPIPSA